MSEPNDRRELRRGSIAVVVAVSLAALGMATALAVDIGFARAQGAQLQALTDAAALGGVMALRDPSAVRVAARAVAEANAVGNEAVELADAEMVIGDWDPDTQTFTPTDEGDGLMVSSVRLVPTLMARIGGFEFMTVPRSSVAQRERHLVRCGIIGASQARWWGSGSIDSYDSSAGPYDPYRNNDEAGVCSNGDLLVGGNGVLYGDASAGVDREPQVSGSGEVTGTTGWLREALAMPTLDWDDVRANNDNAALGLDDPMPLTATSTVLGPGRVLLSAVRMRGQDEIVVVPPLELWIDGDLDMAGQGIVNPTGDPSQLKVFVKGPQVRLRGTADFYGTVVAPEAHVDFSGTADFYGAMLGDTVNITGSGAIHMDESLPLIVEPQMTGGRALLKR